MAQDTFVQFLLETLKDGRLSQTERQEIAARTARATPDLPKRAAAKALAVAVRDRMHKPEDKASVEWLWEVIDLLWQADEPAKPVVAHSSPPAVVGGAGATEAYFGPEDPLADRLQALLRGAKTQIDVAVFTITDNRVSDCLRNAHRRGVKVRVMTDDDKQWDEGSDVRQLADAGIPVVLDKSPHHFHHKFALIDGTTLITGSYNWTRGAALDNRENFLVTRDRGLVQSFSNAFERMWTELSRA